MTRKAFRRKGYHALRRPGALREAEGQVVPDRRKRVRGPFFDELRPPAMHAEGSLVDAITDGDRAIFPPTTFARYPRRACLSAYILPSASITADSKELSPAQYCAPKAKSAAEVWAGVGL